MAYGYQFKQSHRWLNFLLALSGVAILGLGSLFASANDTQPIGELTDPSDISLVEDGQSLYTIVIAADAPLPVKFAAEELQKYLVQISEA